MTGELLQLVSEVDLSSESKIIEFKKWQVQDGSIEGLKALLEEQKNTSSNSEYM